MVATAQWGSSRGGRVRLASALVLAALALAGCNDPEPAPAPQVPSTSTTAGGGGTGPAPHASDDATADRPSSAKPETDPSAPGAGPTASDQPSVDGGDAGDSGEL